MEQKKLIIAVLANSFQAYRDFIRDNFNPNEKYIRIHNVESMIGLRFNRVERARDFLNMKDPYDLIDRLKQRML